MSGHYDIAIIGAGIAGASLAAALGGHGRVVLLEAEDRPGYHTTGRSAAFWTESYGGPGVQPLTTASGAYLKEHGFLHPRAALTIGKETDRERVEAFAARFRDLGVAVDVLAREALERRIPGLREDWTCGALEPSCCDIDVAGLHQHYLSRAQRDGAALLTRARVVAADIFGSRWSLKLADGRTLSCDVLVNAAGAWADTVADMAGAAPLGIQPLRRTMVQVEVHPDAPADLPLVLDVNEAFYFKPESGRLWLSPHDETPSPPCDAAAEEIDVAVAVDRLSGVVDWDVKHVDHRWAGLRSFASDRLPVYGFDKSCPGFFWFAGQGGFGIQTAPAAAELGAALVSEGTPSLIDPAPYSPSRFT